MCLATTYPPGGNARSHQGGAASIADSSSFSVPSVIEERANLHRVREVTERHVLLPMTSSCEEDDWDGPAPTTTNEGCGDETIDPILTMRDREDDDGGTMSGGTSDIVDDASEEDGITIDICGVSFLTIVVIVTIGSFPLIANSDKSFLLLSYHKLSGSFVRR